MFLFFFFLKKKKKDNTERKLMFPFSKTKKQTRQHRRQTNTTAEYTAHYYTSQSWKKTTKLNCMFHIIISILIYTVRSKSGHLLSLPELCSGLLVQHPWSFVPLAPQHLPFVLASASLCSPIVQ